MNKIIRSLLAGVLILSTLALVGCGEEKKYNELKNQIVAVEAQFQDFGDTSAKGLEKHNALKKDIDGKLAEMKKLAASDTKLNNDFIKYQQKINEIDKTWKRVKAENDAVQDIVNQTKDLSIPFDKGLPQIGEGRL